MELSHSTKIDNNIKGKADTGYAQVFIIQLQPWTMNTLARATRIPLQA
jgi:hypothetical protein